MQVVCQYVTTSQIGNPLAVWNACWRALGEDSVRRIRRTFRVPQYNITDQAIRDDALYQIEDLLTIRDHSLQSVGLPLPTSIRISQNPNRLIVEQMSFNTVRLREEAPSLVSTLNPEQLNVYHNITQSVDNNLGKLFFVYDHGGTGKTHLWHVITSVLRAQGKVVLTVASSRIASLLLKGGSTSYARFKIPIELNEESTYTIKKGTHLVDLVKLASLIIWDEAPRSHRICFEALDRTMCDLFNINPLMNPEFTFGGKMVVLGGDFRQTLPVVPGGTRYETVSALIVTSPLWKRCTLFKLTINMRLLRTASTSALRQADEEFGEWILAVGDGTLMDVQSTDESGAAWIRIPADLLLDAANDELMAIIHATYPQLEQHYQNLQYLQECAIVTPKKHRS